MTPESALDDIAALLTPLTYNTGDKVFAQGEKGDSLYLVASGFVRVHDGHKTIDELGAGDVFGEMALFDNEPRSASVSAVQPTLLYRLEQASFFGFLQERPEVARETIKLLSRRLRGQMRALSENHRTFAQLYKASREAERMASELKLAAEVQSSFLPQTPLRFPGWDFAASWQPARELSGDFYDFIALEPGLGLVIADVADKGMPAALFMALARSAVRSSVSASGDVARSIAQVNRLLAADASGGMFVTLVYARLEPQTGVLSYVNAGHNPPLLFRAASRDLLRLERTGIVLGFDAATSFTSRTVELDDGDVALFYTDGVTEAVNAGGEAFGEERLEAFLLEHHGDPAPAMMQTLTSALHDFTGGQTPFDDMTLLIAKRVRG